MKNYILLLFFCFCAHLSIAQNKDAVQTPTAVTEAFTKQHPGITPGWKADGKNYKAYYTDPKTNMGHIIVYDKDGVVIRSENELDKLSSPGAINEYHSKNYPGEEYKIWSVQDHTGVNTYYSEHNSDVLRFDKNGNYVAPKTRGDIPSKK